jgi:hypothetical protein
VRLTRPAGASLWSDTDWGMHAIHGADPRLTGRVAETFLDTGPHRPLAPPFTTMAAAAGVRP